MPGPQKALSTSSNDIESDFASLLSLCMQCLVNQRGIKMWLFTFHLKNNKKQQGIIYNTVCLFKDTDFRNQALSLRKLATETERGRPLPRSAGAEACLPALLCFHAIKNI